MKYTLISGVGYFPLQLLKIGPAIMHITKKLFCKTPRDYAELSTPVILEYAWLYGQPMIIFVITLTYSVISPFLLFSGSAYFLVGYFVNKYLMMYVYFRPYETVGLFWPMIHTRLVYGIYLLQITSIGVFIIKNRIYCATMVIPAVLFTYWGTALIKKSYPKNSKYLPVDFIDFQRKNPTAVEFNYLSISAEESHSKVQTPSSEHQTYFEDCADLQHLANPNNYTDHHQSTMSKFYGILDSSLSEYCSPAFTGVLPRLWLPKNED